MKTFRILLPLLAAAALSLCCGTVPARADEKIVFEVNAGMLVSAGEAFRVEFSLNAEPDSGSFAAPSFEGFDVVAGPVESRGRSIQIVNGSMTNSVSHTISYVLLPRQAGQFRIGAAEIAVKGTKYRTQETMVEVRDRGEAAAGAPAGGGQNGGGQGESLERIAENQVAADDLMLRLALSRTEVYSGEPIRARLKLYSRVNVVGSEGAKMPVFNGFWTQQLDIDQPSSRETVGGRVYETYDIAEYVLYPQQSGTLTIDPAELTVAVQVVVPGRRGFDPFFGGHEVYRVRRNLSSPRVSVRVKDFPAGAPASFTGAVGKYRMEASTAAESLAANSASSLTVRISGTGNLNFIQAPKPDMPGSFELYDVKSSESVRNAASGGMGWRSFEYPFIARAEGEYIIHPVEFSYFDPASESYVTLCSEPFTLTVTPDRSGGSAGAVVSTGANKEDVRLLGSDIRYIKFGDAALRTSRRPLVFSPLWYAVLAATAACGAAAYALMRKRMRDRRNTALMKGRRANKVAVQRFRTAERYMKEHDRRAFYEEMLRALWGYVSDKLNIPVANLTKENVREELHKRGVAAEESQRFTTLISQCDEAQYAPAASTQMPDVYSAAVALISQIESVIKR